MSEPKHTWTTHPIQTKGTHTHWGICGEKGRIVDIYRHVPNYTTEQQDEHAKLIASAPSLLADNKQLREALRFCEAQMAYCEIKDERGPCFGQAISQARSALSAKLG